MIKINYKIATLTLLSVTIGISIYLIPYYMAYNLGQSTDELLERADRVIKEGQAMYPEVTMSNEQRAKRIQILKQKSEEKLNQLDAQLKTLRARLDNLEKTRKRLEAPNKAETSESQ